MYFSSHVSNSGEWAGHLRRPPQLSHGREWGTLPRVLGLVLTPTPLTLATPVANQRLDR